MPTTEKEELLLLESYYRNEAPGMTAFASRVLNNESMAEVAVQETFLTALRRMDKLKSSPNPVGWLYVTLKNIIRHMKRDRQKQLWRVISIDDMPDIPAADNKDLDLWMLLESCSSDDARLLIEFYVEQRSLKELAEEYGITVGACKMRIKRAKERAREI